MDDVLALDATAQADLVRRREVKPIELVEAAIARIEKLNPQINAVIATLYEEARQAAAGDLAGPFAGVPFLLKDDLSGAQAGIPRSAGRGYFGGQAPIEDSDLVRRYKQAGLVILGRTNLPELALLPATEPRLFGATRNPWDLGRTSGGSSGGSAAAVSAGMVAVAHGADGGGSLRIPASCCGVFALKPSRGRMPGPPGVLGVPHVISRSVRDSAALLDASAGADTGSPYLLPQPARPFLAEAEAPSRRLRVAFSTETVAGFDLHPDCVAAVEDAAKLCRSLGHEVREARPSIDGEQFMSAFLDVFTAGTAKAVELTASTKGRPPVDDELEPSTWLYFRHGKSRSAIDYLDALQVFNRISATVASFVEDFDVWLTSTLGSPPLPLGSFEVASGDDLASFSERCWRFSPNTPLFNLTGQPAMTVPLYWNAAGLPIGVQFAGRVGEEGLLLSLAAQLEVARPWRDRWPPIA
jgi:amidase